MNIRGFGKDDKFENKVNWFRRIRTSECPNIVAIQETKCDELSYAWLEQVWGSPNFGCIQKPKIGKSGGMLLIWDTIKGNWIGHSEETVIVNIYGPHNDEGKAKLWESLESLLSYQNAEWVLCEDFNEVRYEHERKNCEFIARRADRFNSFIDNSSLIDVPLVGKRFTRISNDGVKMSKIDRFLVSENFNQTWGDITCCALDQNTSDHCPIILKDSNSDFSPKPFRVFDVWFEQEVVEQIQQYGQIDIEIENAKKLTLDIEQKAETQDLTEGERESWLKNREIWLKREKEKIAMLKQKARSKWASDGDENSRFFHSMLRRNRNRSNIHGLHIDGIWQENPVTI
ncbi:uncharacterized protein [Rutidosis leptorrhynchoides]|uniref:uncharacterized protein n=1 Tax=Rutidosis leptorrhynchoides TaxID=125765 RepID=UPI003A995199